MKEDVLFKRTPFGGFDRVEVISYIQQLKTTQQKYAGSKSNSASVPKIVMRNGGVKHDDEPKRNIGNIGYKREGRYIFAC